MTYALETFAITIHETDPLQNRNIKQNPYDCHRSVGPGHYFPEQEMRRTRTTQLRLKARFSVHQPIIINGPGQSIHNFLKILVSTM